MPCGEYPKRYRRGRSFGSSSTHCTAFSPIWVVRATAGGTYSRASAPPNGARFIVISHVAAAVRLLYVAASRKVYTPPGRSVPFITTRLGRARPVEEAAARSIPTDGVTDHARRRGAFAGEPSGARAVPKRASFEVGFCLRCVGTAIETDGSAPASTVIVAASVMASVLGAGLDTVRRKTYAAPPGSALLATTHSHSLSDGGVTPLQAVPSDAFSQVHEKSIPPPQRPVVASHVAVGSSGSLDEHASRSKPSSSPTVREPPAMLACSGSSRSEMSEL